MGATSYGAGGGIHRAREHPPDRHGCISTSPKREAKRTSGEPSRLDLARREFAERTKIGPGAFPLRLLYVSYKLINKKTHGEA